MGTHRGYVRNGTANVFMFVDVNRPWRHAKVTDQRIALDFADCMKRRRSLFRCGADSGRPRQPFHALHRRIVRGVLPSEVRRIPDRLKFYYTPKHASWLNMVEIEIGVMFAQCPDRRIPEKAIVVSEVANWERRRNAERARINCMFTIDRARVKLRRACPVPADQRVQAAA